MIYISNRKIPNVYYSLQKTIFGDYELVKSFLILKPKIYYCGRPSILGNPFSYLSNSIARYKCKKEEVLPNYEKYLWNLSSNSEQILLLKEIKEESINNNICLECWCVPKKCHCEITYKYIEKELK